MANSGFNDPDVVKYLVLFHGWQMECNADPPGRSRLYEYHHGSHDRVGLNRQIFW